MRLEVVGGCMERSRVGGACDLVIRRREAGSRVGERPAGAGLAAAIYNGPCFYTRLETTASPVAILLDLWCAFNYCFYFICLIL